MKFFTLMYKLNLKIYTPCTTLIFRQYLYIWLVLYAKPILKNVIIGLKKCDDQLEIFPNIWSYASTRGRSNLASIIEIVSRCLLKPESLSVHTFLNNCYFCDIYPNEKLSKILTRPSQSPFQYYTPRSQHISRMLGYTSRRFYLQASILSWSKVRFPRYCNFLWRVIIAGGYLSLI